MTEKPLTRSKAPTLPSVDASTLSGDVLMRYERERTKAVTLPRITGFLT